jgi:hypothetical protein
MSYKKILLVVCAISASIGLQAQNDIPSELIGKWKMVNIYALDSLGNNDAAETAALMLDMVDSTIVEYVFTDSTFTLHMDGELSGTCNYTVENANLIVFDENGYLIADMVNSLKLVEVTTTNLYLEAGSPDYESGIIFHEFLIKQP